MNPHVIQVIQTSICKGAGTTEDPCRSATQYFTLDGEFLAENDPKFNDAVDGRR